MTLLSFFFLVLVVQIGYLMLLRIGFRTALDDFQRAAGNVAAARPPISVVVAARDEEDVLPHLLNALAEQTHPEFEVVVVDDASDDGTRDLLRQRRHLQRNLRVVEIDDPKVPRKKHALTAGIAAARHELLAFTDADCVPPPRWLDAASTLLNHASEPRLAIGYSPFRVRPGLFNRFARYETFLTGYMTAAAIGMNRPYMAVGRNLFYSKSIFERTGGFGATMGSLSGDDDLFVQQVAGRGTARILQLFGKETYVPTDAPPDLRAWIRQKIRHTSAGRFYARGIQVHLTLHHATATLLWIAPLVVGWWGALFLGTRLVVQGVFLREGAQVLDEQKLFPAQPLLEFLYAVYNVFIAPIGLLRMPRRW